MNLELFDVLLAFGIHGFSFMMKMHKTSPLNWLSI